MGHDVFFRQKVCVVLIRFSFQKMKLIELINEFINKLMN